MRSLSILGGRFLGVEFRIHLSFLFLVVYILWPAWDNGLDSRAVSRAFALAGLALLSVFLHELGHILAALRNGIAIRGSVLLPLGGIPFPDRNPEIDGSVRMSQEVRVAAAGPAVSALLAAVSGLVVLSTSGASSLLAQPWMDVGALGKSFFWINALLFAVNLLPAFPLDGGRVLRTWMVAARNVEYRRATRRAATIGHLFAAAFILAGGWISPWLMLLGLFLFMATQIEERAALFYSVAETVKMEDIMLTHFSTLSAADTLQDALSKAVHTLQDDFPVVSGGDLVGVINRQTIVERLRRDGDGYVQSAMNRTFEIASRTETLAEASSKLAIPGLTLIPVVDQERLVGIVTPQNLVHCMGLLQVSRQLKKKMEEEM
jgi:Zn-dependent protease/CBS domain-containing protein